MLNQTFNKKDVESILRTPVNSATMRVLQPLIERLQVYQRAFSQLSEKMLNKNGFTAENISIYKNRVASVLQTAIQRFSNLLAADQLPGQQALFAPPAYEQARRAGKIDVEGIIFQRQEKINNLIKGRSCSIAFALNKTVTGYYAIIEADQLQPSHLGEVQNPLHFIPEAQPRNRSASASGANTPRTIAQHLQPAQIIEGATAYTGAPIVNLRGETIQGNGRAYTLKYYWQINPEDTAGYRQFIKQAATCYGFPAGFPELKKYSCPVMVRVTDATDPEAIKLGQFVAKDLEAVATETTQTKSRVNLLSDATKQKLIDKLTDDGGDATLSELIRTSGALRVLIDGGAVRADEQEIYTKDGRINEAGVLFIQRLLMGLVFKGGDVNAPDVFAMLPVPLQRAIEKAVLHILRLPKSHSINRELTEAVLLTRDYIGQGRPPFKMFINQTSAFDAPIAERFSPLTVRLVQLFDEMKTQRDLVQLFAKYARLSIGSAGDMFLDETEGVVRHQAIKEIFGTDILPFEKQRLKALLKSAK